MGYKICITLAKKFTTTKTKTINTMKIKYEQLFPTASFLNCRIGFETEIPDDGDVDMELRALKDIAQAFHMKEFPQLYVKNSPIYKGEEQEREVQVNKVTDEVQAMLDGINNSPDIKELSSWWLRSKGNLVLSNAYKTKEKQLTDAKQHT